MSAVPPLISNADDGPLHGQKEVGSSVSQIDVGSNDNNLHRACDTCRRAKKKCPSTSTNQWPCDACAESEWICVPPGVGRDRNGVDAYYANYLDQSHLPMMFILRKSLVPIARRSPNEFGDVSDDSGYVIGQVKIVRDRSSISHAKSLLKSGHGHNSILSEENLANASEDSLFVDQVAPTILPYRNVVEGDSVRLEGREPDENGDVFDEDENLIGRVEVVRGLVLVINPKAYTRPAAKGRGSGSRSFNLALQQGVYPTRYDMEHFSSSSSYTILWLEAPMPELTIGSSVADSYQEPASPDEHDLEPRQLHQKAMKSGTPRGRRSKGLTTAQKEHARLVRNAGPKQCHCSQRKVKCRHVVAESSHSPSSQGPGTFLAAPYAQRETATYRQQDTALTQNTSWLIENTPISAFSPSPKQSFENITNLDMPPTSLIPQAELDYHGKIQTMNDFTLDNSPHLNSKPLMQRYDDTRDTQLRLSLPDIEGQAPSQNHSAAALDKASARTLLHAKSPKLKPRPSPSTFGDAKETPPKSNAFAEAIVRVGEAKSNAEYETEKAGESMADSRGSTRDKFAQAGGRSKGPENWGARRKEGSPYSNNAKSSGGYVPDTPRHDSPKGDSPEDDFWKECSPKSSRPDQIKGGTEKSSSNRHNIPKLPARPRHTYSIPIAVPKTQSDSHHVNESSQHFQIRQSNAARFLKQPSFRARKITVYAQWLNEHTTEPPLAIWKNAFSVSLPLHDTLTISDRAKTYVERLSGREWDWWPADPPERPIQPNKVRLQWQCDCGHKRYADCSPALVRKCVRLCELALVGGHRKHGSTDPEGSEHTRTSANAPTEDHERAGTGAGIRTSLHKTLHNASIAGQHQGTNETQQGSCRPDFAQQFRAKFFVLLGVKQNSRIDHTQLETSGSTYSDSRFFDDLRDQYRSLRGFYRYWLSPFIFSHCSFVKYTRFYVNELAHVGLNLPVDPTYVYTPRPPGPHEDPPISAHEFNRRFYTNLCNPCGRSEAVTRIPKRSQRFQTNLHVDGREDMWGLHVELCPSFFRVLLWSITVTAGGWALMAWWLEHHKNDLQGASVPITIIMTALMALYVPLWERMK